MNAKLSEGLKKLSLEFSEEQIGQLETYCRCVMEFNKTYNLMKADNEDELYVNHVLDSLAAAPYLVNLIKDGTKVGDIGSGGGCPGIPLAVAFPNADFTLVERMEKRCAFLENAVKAMNLKNVKILCKQVDLVDPELFEVEVFRAFHPFDKKISKWLLKMLKKGGILAAYKAREEKIVAEMEEVKFIIPEYKRIKLTVPFLEDHERNLVVVKK
ncbi:16S rRNA (guanine(527)-N(7))-methyltransferase RsmG [Treponema sp.]|uniref:16S rRNA (guanine(527)-N(7))-methyltransferase RsmG n=1 Tax=Treponema sp. TaxID=166 RepID=UPI00298E99FA|nr:16S rRNA (guanine(527)-N(7))-methyltransferase RsmG [Treponema sp.]MCQ2241133.1 16S rRNA (guanine(527)-N(7))-methyltransferase RsmG [Treponema sp.]